LYAKLAYLPLDSGHHVPRMGTKQHLAQPQNIYVPRKSSYQGLGFLNLTSEAPTTDVGKSNDRACQIFASQLEYFAGEKMENFDKDGAIVVSGTAPKEG
jgi:hypothetical protein